MMSMSNDEDSGNQEDAAVNVATNGAEAHEAMNTTDQGLNYLSHAQDHP